jgi:hypothetical protein
MLHSSGLVASAKIWGLENAHQAIHNARDSPKQTNFFCASCMNKAYGLFFFCRIDRYRHSACLDIWNCG